ncbi:MAG: hypothetical protein ACTHN3_12290 [Solirubrobacterales bacterium]
MKRLAVLLTLGAALLAVNFVGASTASATVICKTAANPCTSETLYPKGTVIEASLKSGVKSILENTSINLKAECEEAAIKGEVTNAGSEGSNVSGTVTTFSFGKCLHGYTATVKKTGTFTISYTEGGNGTLKLEGFETTYDTPLGFSCTYAGSVAVSLNGGAMSSIVASSVSVSRTGDSSLCGTSATWNSEYTVTAPEPLYVEKVSSPESVLCKTATSPCSGGTYPNGTVIEASLKSGVRSTLKNTSVGLEAECEEAAIKGEVTNAGSGGGKVSGTISLFKFASCKNGYSVTTLKTGTFTISYTEGGNGTLKLEGFETTVATPLGFSCTYAGSVAVSLNGGAMSSMVASSVSVSRTGDSSLCGTSATWNSEYTVTAPEPLYVEES